MDHSPDANRLDERRYSRSELIADGVFHILGVALAIAGSFWLLIAAETSGAMMFAISAYLAALIVSITVSAAYNMAPISRLKGWLRRFDHSAIYLLIAGTYTPVMAEIAQWWLLTGVWTVALIGVAIKLFLPGRYDGVSIVIYLAMGWSGAVVFDQLVTTLPPKVFWLLGAGGILYTVGVIFHLWSRLAFQNAIWHGFVLAAAALHFAAVAKLGVAA